MTPLVWTRDEAIDRLREPLRRLCDAEHSMCQVAAERRIFCQGFRRWPDSEFHDRWKATLGESTHLTRPQMEELADLWQLAEQVRARKSLICDAQGIGPGACRGWDEFDNSTLAGYCRELLGQNVVVMEAA